eukprot:jgi/Hompol1/2590/HPOL_002963-RA
MAQSTHTIADHTASSTAATAATTSIRTLVNSKTSVRAVVIPLEVARCIFSYLEAFELARCNAVSREWRLLSLEPKLWQMHCLLSGVFDAPTDDLLAMNHHRSSSECSISFAPEGLRWKTVFARFVTRSRNWKHGIYVKKIIDAVQASDAITGFGFDTNRIVVGTRDRMLHLTHIASPEFWAPAKQTLVPDISFSDPKHPSPIMCLASPLQADGGTLASADTSGDIVLWNAFTGKCIASLKHAHKGGDSIGLSGFFA